MSPASTRGAAGVERITVNFSDSVNLPDDGVRWSPRGVTLRTKWYFPEGTELEFAFDHAGERHCHRGIVVACRPLAAFPRSYLTVLYFFKKPCRKLQRAAHACRLDGEAREAFRDGV